LATGVPDNQLLAYYLELLGRIFNAVKKELSKAIRRGKVCYNKGEEILAQTWTKYLYTATDGCNVEKGTRRSSLYNDFKPTVRS
jgi:hypothetical protein